MLGLLRLLGHWLGRLLLSATLRGRVHHHIGMIHSLQTVRLLGFTIEHRARNQIFQFLGMSLLGHWLSRLLLGAALRGRVHHHVGVIHGLHALMV